MSKHYPGILKEAKVLIALSKHKKSYNCPFYSYSTTIWRGCRWESSSTNTSGAKWSWEISQWSCTEFFGRSDDPEVVLQPADHSSCDGHRSLETSSNTGQLQCHQARLYHFYQKLYLQSVTGRFVSAEFVGDSGEQTMIGHNGLQSNSQNKNTPVGKSGVMSL